MKDAKDNTKREEKKVDGVQASLTIGKMNREKLTLIPLEPFRSRSKLVASTVGIDMHGMNASPLSLR
jgi:hypothetical protein